MRKLIILSLILPISACSLLNGADNSAASSKPNAGADEQPGATANPATAANPSPSLPSFSTQQNVTCRSGDDIRNVQIETKKGGACRLHYTLSDGSKQVLAQSENDPEYCQQALQQFTHNLIRARFECH